MANAEAQTAEGKLYLFVAIDRTSTFAVTQRVEKGRQTRNRRDQKDRLAPHSIGEPTERQLGHHRHGGADGKERSDLSNTQAPSIKRQSGHGNDRPHGETVQELVPLKDIHMPTRGYRQLCEGHIGVSENVWETQPEKQALQLSSWIFARSSYPCSP